MSRATEITSKLWAMANKLRGTMDASEYKNYILPFMFYRYLSENQEKKRKDLGLELSDMQTEDGEWVIREKTGYLIKYEYLWAHIVEKVKSGGIKASDFHDMFQSFKENVSTDENKAGFENVFSDVNLGDTRLGSNTNDRAAALKDIILMIDEFDFKDETGHDILGDVYEYLIGQFAANAGKKGGEFYTPHEVSKIMAKIVAITKSKESIRGQLRVYDPTMGSGSLLLTVQKEFSDKISDVEFYGQELNTTTYNLARMNLMMHDVDLVNMFLNRGNTLDSEDWPFQERDGQKAPKKVDAVVANPPYSQNWDTKTVDRTKDARFRSYGIAPASKADYAFILHGLFHLEEDGTMAIVLPHGVLFRGAAEGKIRQKLIEENVLDAVIGLPANLFYGTSIPTCILVFRGRKARKDKTDVLFIDASREFEKGKNQNKLTEENISKIIDTYRNRESIEKYSHVASLEEIVKNDYNLNIPRYVDTYEEEPVVPLSEIAQQLKDVREEIHATEQELYAMFRELEGTTDEAKEELKKFLEILGI
ncbi:type I restriction-modification system subunit M [Mycoplasma sp. Ms02]|uniref:type I restriction-modification system subunit M n=1 Tax=Mycoplasma sp. Ms02 TaxID=353851 RepID=UPI001C8992FC|nr:type I restriction-modification system subunit M [Mycoplasma sp. Ms02]QZE12177.1 type I restriction-modification system subunit M [Mycoplasma sp. Ms02]